MSFGIDPTLHLSRASNVSETGDTKETKNTGTFCERIIQWMTSSKEASKHAGGSGSFSESETSGKTYNFGSLTIRPSSRESDNSLATSMKSVETSSTAKSLLKALRGAKSFVKHLVRHGALETYREYYDYSSAFQKAVPKKGPDTSEDAGHTVQDDNNIYKAAVGVYTSSDGKLNKSKLEQRIDHLIKKGTSWHTDDLCSMIEVYQNSGENNDKNNVCVDALRIIKNSLIEAGIKKDLELSTEEVKLDPDKLMKSHFIKSPLDAIKGKLKSYLGANMPDDLIEDIVKNKGNNDAFTKCLCAIQLNLEKIQKIGISPNESSESNNKTTAEVSKTDITPIRDPDFNQKQNDYERLSEKYTQENTVIKQECLTLLETFLSGKEKSYRTRIQKNKTTIEESEKLLQEFRKTREFLKLPDSTKRSGDLINLDARIRGLELQINESLTQSQQLELAIDKISGESGKALQNKLSELLDNP